MQFRVLGSVEVVDGQRVLPVPGGRPLALLGVLLLHANRVVTVPELAEHLWPEAPPKRPRGAIQTYVGRLRGALGDGLIHTRPHGYLIEVDDDNLDLARFRRLVAASSQAAPQERERLLGEAVALWRGEPPPGATRLVEERLHAVEQWMDARLDLGRHAEAVAELTALAAGHPLRERFWAQLMLALYRCGRQADALDAYRTVSRHLAEELGIDPGDELRHRHQAVLAADPTLLTAAHMPVAPADQPHNYLPRDLPDFTGRRRELDEIVRAAHSHAGAAPVIVAVDGMAGVGKTALALHTAHQLVSDYPDGQLFVDLHGYSGRVAPLSAAAALDTLLRLLGLPGERIPADLDGRAARWRAELAGRKALVVLDNALDAAQVSPLLPASSGSLVLVTSRRRLTDLHGVHSLTLDLLPAADAGTLFLRTVDDHRRAVEAGAAGKAADEDPDKIADKVAGKAADKIPDEDAGEDAHEAVGEITAMCGNLPLAIRLAGGRLRHRPAWTAGYLAERLRDERRRLGELAAGQTTVSAAFAVSYQHLHGDQQRLFRLLGLHPGPDADAYAAAALAGQPLDAVERLLENLLDAHLLVQATPGRYRFHDLIRQHARDTAAAEEPAAARDAALARLLDYYLYVTIKACYTIVPNDRLRDASVATPPVDVPALPDDDAGTALTWLDGEARNIAAVAALASELGRWAHAWQFASATASYSIMRCRNAEWRTLGQAGLEAARRLDDRIAEAAILFYHGNSYSSSGHTREAARYYEATLRLAREYADQPGQLAALRELGHIQARLGRYPEGLRHLRECRDISRRTGNVASQAHALVSIGIALDELGSHAAAADELRAAIELTLGAGDLSLEAFARGRLGSTLVKLGTLAEARPELEAAARMAAKIGDTNSLAQATSYLGTLHDKLGAHPVALAHHNSALEQLAGSGVVDTEQLVRLGLADSHLASGNLPEAEAQYTAALRLGATSAYLYMEARAHDGLARCHDRAGNPDLAQPHRHQALVLRATLGIPTAPDNRP